VRYDAAGMPTKTTAALHDGDGLLLLRCENLLVAAWRQAPSMLEMKIVGTHIAQLHRDHGEEVGFVNLAISGKAELITKEVRDEGNRLARRWASACSAHVVLVEGLAGVVVRSILRAMSVVSGHSTPWRVFDDIHTAAPWIAERIDGRAGCTWNAADVEAILADAAHRRAPG
jgi:hypothetical protein